MKLDDARFPLGPSPEFGPRVLAAARREPHPRRPTLLPELLDGVGWAAAVWVGGILLGEFFQR